MNLSSSLDMNAQQLQRPLNTEAQRVKRVAEAKAERVMAAVVTEISTLTEAERAQVLDKLKQATASTQTPPDPLQVKNLKQWSVEPLLRLVGLKAGGRNFYTVTSLQLKVEQTVRVLVRADGQLQLLNSLSGEGPKAQKAYGLGEAAPRANAPGAAATALNSTQLQLISSSLRSALPQQTSLKSAFEFIATLETALTSLPRPAREGFVPPAVQSGLQALKALAMTPKMLSQPEGVRQALQQSGNLLESKLAARSAGFGAQHAQQPGAAARTRDPALDTDIKAVLLHVLREAQQHLSNTGNPLSLKSTGGPDRLIASLLGFRTGSAQSKQPTETRNQLLQQVSSQLSAALAKIQTQQLQSLNQRFGEMGQPSLGGYFELPIRLPDGYSSISLHIQEYRDRQEPEEEDGAETRRERKTVPQWEVQLAFNLGDYGQLTSQVKVLNNTVSAKFWAEKPCTRTLAREQLTRLHSQMKASGLQVADIQCLPGQPPRRQLKLNYNLVDITT